MKKLILISILMLATISLGAFFEAVHTNLFSYRYENCKATLIAINNYQSNQQVIDCVESSISIKILGTLLFREGTVLK